MKRISDSKSEPPRSRKGFPSHAESHTMSATLQCMHMPIETRKTQQRNPATSDKDSKKLEPLSICKCGRLQILAYHCWWGIVPLYQCCNRQIALRHFPIKQLIIRFYRPGDCSINGSCAATIRSYSILHRSVEIRKIQNPATPQPIVDSKSSRKKENCTSNARRKHKRSHKN